MKPVAWLTILLITAFPAAGHASVIISEFMYDLQTGSDGGREWIEVYNAGSNSVRLTDWKLFEGNVNHTIAAYTGGDDLASGAYAVIADNPSKFLEDWTAYSGLLFDSAFSLSNTGEVLGIRTPGTDAKDTDMFSYVNAAGAAGDGNSLHRSASDTAVFAPSAPSPGAGALALIPGLAYVAPAPSNTDSGAASTTSNTASEKATQTPIPSYVPPPVHQLFADAGEDRIVIVGADTHFHARAYNRDQEIVENVRFSWNFGDGSTLEGSSVTHHFSYPGRYVVILSIAQDRSAASDRVIVTAEPAKLAFAVHGDGSVSIQNLSGRDLDLSYWIVRSFMQSFSLPEGSIILAGETLRIPQKNLGFFSTAASAELLYPNGVTAMQAGELQISATAPPGPVFAPAVPMARASSQAASALPPPDSIEESDPPVKEAVLTYENPEVAAAAVFAPKSYWWIGVIAFAVLSGFAVIAIRRMRSSEWNIIEE